MDVKGYLDRYLEVVSSRKPNNAGKTYVQSVLIEYLPYIVWDEVTFFKDMGTFFALAQRCEKRIGIAPLKNRLDWVKSKNSLHPRQVFKVLLKK